MLCSNSVKQEPAEGAMGKTTISAASTILRIPPLHGCVGGPSPNVLRSASHPFPPQLPLSAFLAGRSTCLAEQRHRQEEKTSTDRWRDDHTRKMNSKSSRLDRIEEEDMLLLNCSKQRWVGDGHSYITTQDNELGSRNFKCMAFEAYTDACQAQHLQNHNGCEMPMSPEEPLALLEWTAEPPMLEILICILQKCRKRRTLCIAEHVHAHVCNIGLEVHKALGNYLISMFVECGSLSYAQQVFSRLVHRNEHSWTSLLQGCIECDDLQHAFRLYQQMQEDGVHPSRYTFVPLLTACTRLKSLERGLEIHGEIAMEGFEEDIFLCNALVSMYAKCGSLTECEELFNTLPSRDVVSWTALIVGYVEQGLGQKALNCWERMQLEEVAPDSMSYVCGLKACGSLRAINRGQEIHAGIVKEGLKSDLLVANTLVDMYAKCGSLEEAQKVFDELCVRDVVTWTALISGYAEYGLSEEALNCLEQMELEGIHWDPVILVSGLKASGSLGAVNRGQKIHAEIVKQGFENISFVGSTLVGMYAKCGLFVEAHEVLDTLPIRDAVSWNALISGYAEHGYGEKSLDSFEQMQLEGVSQDPVTYLSSLKACGDVGDLQRGQAIHGQITKKGFGRDATIGNMLVYMYVKCDSFLEAWEVFDELPVQDVVSWTSLIAGYADRGFGEDALDILEQMQLNGVSTDNVAFLCGLKTCGSIGASGRGREIHVEIVKNGFDRNPLVGNTLVDMYAKCGLLVEAHQVFHELSVQDLVSWNALISGYAEQGLGEEALECFEKMRLKDMSPDAVTFVGILKACGSPEAIHRGLTLHAAVVKQGLERDHIVCNALVEMYAKCSPLKVTHEIFYKMPVGDVVSWNTLIGLYVEQGLHEEALSCFQQMQFKGISPDRVSWSGLILAYAEQGESEKAVNFYAQMQGQSLTPDNTVLLSVLKACVNTAMMEMGRRIHAQVARLETMEVNLATAFIDMYGRCGSMTDAQQLFDAMRMRDLVTWDALIRGYARQGDTERVFHLFETLMEEGLQPDDVMFLTILSLCMHVGLVEKAQKYFEVMSKDYGLTPSIKHVTCMIDLLGRAGQLDEAVRLVEKMPFQPNLVVWHTMLGACQKWGNTELGRWAFEHAVGLDRKHATAYVLMSNIYVDAHMWEEAAKIEAMRMEMQKGFMSSYLASSNAGEEEDSLIPPF